MSNKHPDFFDDQERDQHDIFNITVCAECGDDEFFCSCYDDSCCYSINYTGEPGTCRCAEQAETEYYNSKSWIWRIWDYIKRRPARIKYRIRLWFVYKRYCDKCNKFSLMRRWKEDVCPKCGYDHEPDLPF